MRARSDVYAAGDVACFYDVVLGRRRVEHHDHAVVSGRLAGENMAALGPAKHYTHQSMFWSDLGPQLGYEVSAAPLPRPHPGRPSAHRALLRRLSASSTRGFPQWASSQRMPSGPSSEAVQSPAESRRYERGVVFYLRERRVVGVLLWNLFNRMHVARQVRPPHCPTRLPPAVWGSRCHSWFCAGSGAGLQIAQQNSLLGNNENLVPDGWMYGIDIITLVVILDEIWLELRLEGPLNSRALVHGTTWPYDSYATGIDQNVLEGKMSLMDWTQECAEMI
ncbi:hypothetical protein HW555_014250 [Spodoptera exigua]|uniref:Mitochondrial apoptosis-inducing factor C-terminal domain-containing protein n=1 Tax=Spodoptera exigua TaxID=7107 RepID=A0A835G016_SPOEX|nr:hypothetical protein HW555_014250 [Spodoptera exigua]